MRKRMVIAVALSGLLLGAIPTPIGAHCQVPCGIYGDDLKFKQLFQHIETIRKSMRLTRELSADPKANANQLVRWINNKDLHADQFAEAISYYFLQQRIKVNEAEKDREGYVAKLILCHKLIVYAMECKATTDQAKADQLRETLQKFEAAYMDEEKKAHMAGEHGGGME